MDGNTEFLAMSAPFSRTLSEQVANQLREAILRGQLKPGQRIVEHEIAEAMSLSRGPVREALKILQHERLVVQYPHRGAFVARLKLRDAEEIYSLRAALETLAMHYAIRYATDDQINEMVQVVDTMRTRIEQGYTQTEATDLDLEFHYTLCRISGHSRVLAAWTALREQVRLLILTHRVMHPADFREQAIEWHLRLVEAISKRDAKVAEELLREHLSASFEQTSETIRRNEEEFPLDTPQA